MARPTEWSFASSDLNVLLTGKLIDHDDDDRDDTTGQDADQVKFLLDLNGLYIVSARLEDKGAQVEQGPTRPLHWPQFPQPVKFTAIDSLLSLPSHTSSLLVCVIPFCRNMLHSWQ